MGKLRARSRETQRACVSTVISYNPFLALETDLLSYSTPLRWIGRFSIWELCFGFYYLLLFCVFITSSGLIWSGVIYLWRTPTRAASYKVKLIIILPAEQRANAQTHTIQEQWKMALAAIKLTVQPRFITLHAEMWGNLLAVARYIWKSSPISRDLINSCSALFSSAVHFWEAERCIDSLMKTPVSVILMFFFSFLKPRSVDVLFFYVCYNRNQKKGAIMSVVVRSDALAV